MPLGAALALLGRSRLQAALVAASLSVAVELAQYFVVAGRDAAARDVISNALGGLLGAQLVLSWVRVAHPSSNGAIVLVRVGAAIWLAITCLTSWAVQRAPATAQTYVVSHKPVCCLEHSRYRGAVLSASVAGQSLVPGVIRDTLALRRLPADAPLTAALSITPSAPSRNTALIFGLFDGDIRSQVLFEQDGRSARFSVRLRADAALLRPPLTALPYALPADRRGGAVRLEGAYERGRISISSTQDGWRHATRIALGPGLGWSLVSPFEVPVGGDAGIALNSLWMLGLTLPLGYWWRVARSGSVVIGAALIMGLVVVPLLLSVAPGGIPDWIGVLAGLLLGMVIASRHSAALVGSLRQGRPRPK